jgi:hypothetical protein
MRYSIKPVPWSPYINSIIYIDESIISPKYIVSVMDV